MGPRLLLLYGSAIFSGVLPLSVWMPYCFYWGLLSVLKYLESDQKSDDSEVSWIDFIEGLLVLTISLLTSQFVGYFLGLTIIGTRYVITATNQRLGRGSGRFHALLLSHSKSQRFKIKAIDKTTGSYILLNLPAS